MFFQPELWRQVLEGYTNQHATNSMEKMIPTSVLVRSISIPSSGGETIQVQSEEASRLPPVDD